LADVIAVVLVELPNGKEQAVVKGQRAAFKELDSLTQLLQVRRRLYLEVLLLENKLHRLGPECEDLSELVPRPLNAVQRFLWEELECAVRDLVLLSGVGLLTIGLGEFREDDLYVTLGAERARLDQRDLVGNTPHVHVAPRLDVVKCVYH